MRKINLLLLLFLVAVGANAQTSVTSSDAPDVIVVKKQWSFQFRNPALDESPFIEMEELLEVQQAARERAAENRRRGRMGLKPVNMPAERPPVERKDGPASAAYVYEIKIKNAGEKDIQALTLEYVFFEPNTEKEVGRRRFMSKQEIGAGKTRNLIFRSVSPPTGAVNANEAGKKSSKLYSEKVVIQSVEYTDGSKWNAAPKNQ